MLRLGCWALSYTAEIRRREDRRQGPRAPRQRRRVCLRGRHGVSRWGSGASTSSRRLSGARWVDFKDGSRVEGLDRPRHEVISVPGRTKCPFWAFARVCGAHGESAPIAGHMERATHSVSKQHTLSPGSFRLAIYLARWAGIVARKSGVGWDGSAARHLSWTD